MTRILAGRGLRAWLWGIGLSALVGAAVAGEDDTYIFDVLARANYRAAYTALIKRPDMPDWVRDVVRTGDGLGKPHTIVVLAGKDYRVDHVCKVNDCASHALTVLFAPHGQKAWGWLIDDKGAPIVLGAPKPDIAQILEKAAQP